MFRNSLENLPDHYKADYMDTNPNCVEKVKVLKNAIRSKFPVSAFHFSTGKLSISHLTFALCYDVSSSTIGFIGGHGFPSLV